MIDGLARALLFLTSLLDSSYQFPRTDAERREKAELQRELKRYRELRRKLLAWEKQKWLIQ